MRSPKQSISGAYDLSGEKAPRIQILSRDSEDMVLKFTNVRLDIPSSGETLLRDVTMVINKGDKVALAGPNGSGKSSLFRVLRRLWDRGEGVIEEIGTGNAHVFCASQRPRLPDTLLDGVLSYPLPADHFEHAEYERVLREVELEKIIRFLPWKVLEPANILELCGPIVFTGIEKNLQQLKGQQEVDNFLRGFTSALDKCLSVPEKYKKYYSPKVRSDLVRSISALISQMEKNNGVFGQIGPEALFPEHKGRKAGKKIAAQIYDALKFGSMTGNRLEISGGEVQKLVFARIFLQKPDILLLDEITSALHEDTSHSLYKKMVSALPGSIILSIIHDTSLLPYHTYLAQVRNQSVSYEEINIDGFDKPSLFTCPKCPYKPDMI